MSISTFELSLKEDVGAAMQGNEQALTRLLGRCRHVVTSIALAIVRDLDASEEVAQEVFVQVWKQLPKLRKANSFMPWLRQLTRRRALNYIRNERVNTRVPSADAEQLLASIAAQSDVAQDFARDQQDFLVRSLLDKLDAENREVVLLYYREEQSSQQVSALLGISEANVRKRLQRVRQQLKEDWLATYGRAVLQSSAPVTIISATFVQTMLSAAASASPGAITAGAASSAGQSGTLLAKLAWLLGGAAIATLVAVIGVVVGMSGSLKLVRTEHDRKQLLRIRKLTVIWVIAAGAGLTAAYAFSSGWLAPVTVFSLLVGGLIYQNLAVWRIVGPIMREQAQQSEAGMRAYRHNIIGCFMGMFFGYGGGFAGLVLGLWQSGRFFI